VKQKEEMTAGVSLANSKWDKVVALGTTAANKIVTPEVLAEMKLSMQELIFLRAQNDMLDRIGASIKIASGEKDKEKFAKLGQMLREHLVATNKLFTKRKKLNAKLSATMLIRLFPSAIDGIRIVRPVKLSVAHTKYGSVMSWVEALLALTNGAAGGELTVKKAAGQEGYGRSFYDEQEKAIYLRPNPTMATVWHELGHWLEHTVPGALEASHEFYRYRTSESKTKPISALTPDKPGHNPWEKAKAGRFIEPYVGKTYRVGSTEITSMGLEYLVEDPARLYFKDREHFYFTLGMLVAAQQGKMPWA
jgi:hypothetical protein